MKTEQQKMLSGEAYDPMDRTLVDARMRARRILTNLNNLPQSKHGPRKNAIESLFGSTGKGVYIESPFRCDYGENIHVGDDFYANFDCVILDAATVTFGHHCKLGPQVGIYTATHPTDAGLRTNGIEYAHPITIGDEVWIGGNATILPGVKLGDGTVVGAGAVVTRSFAQGNVVIAGNPAKVIKTL